MTESGQERSETIKKPKKQSREKVYNFRECRKYINQKYNIEQDDYAGRISRDQNAPFLCFWHWLVDKYYLENGDTVTLDSSDIDDAEPWVQEIFAMYIKEFGDGCTFDVSW